MMRKRTPTKTQVFYDPTIEKPALIPNRFRVIKHWKPADEWAVVEGVLYVPEAMRDMAKQLIKQVHGSGRELVD